LLRTRIPLGSIKKNNLERLFIAIAKILPFIREFWFPNLYFSLKIFDKTRERFPLPVF
jgi:hypothetical protein